MRKMNLFMEEIEKMNQGTVKVIQFSGENEEARISMPIADAERCIRKDGLEDFLQMVSEEIAKAEDMLKDFNMNLDTYLGNVLPVVINRKNNEEMLRSVPHEVVNEELALIYRAFLDNERNFIVQHGMYSEKVKEAAFRNLRQKILINSLTGCFFGFPHNLTVEEACELIKEGPIVVRTELFGAAAMLLPELEKLMDGCYIIPSSIHEIILVDKEIMDLNYAKSMVQEVNHDVVDQKDFLSDEVFELINEKIVVAK